MDGQPPQPPQQPAHDTSRRNHLWRGLSSRRPHSPRLRLSERARLQAQPVTLEKARASGAVPSEKASLAPPQGRPAVPGETRLIAAPATQPRSAARLREPLFVLSTARRRRARYSVRRGGYYGHSAVHKPRSLPRPVAWLLGITGILWMFVVALLLVGGVAGYAGYWYFARDLPSIDNIHGLQFETSRIYDRYGNLLYEMYDPSTGKRTYIPVDRMPRSLIDATIAVEDRSFEENSGVDPTGIARAVYITLLNKGTSGGSTITQQLVRRVLLPEKDERTFSRKIREAILAVQMTQKYSKEKILEIYLNEIYYGSLSYGVAAAADTYFGKHVEDLTLAQSAMLAGLPQAPGDYDPNQSFALAKARQKIVLGLMAKNGFITQAQSDAAYAEDVHPVARRPNVPLKAPHFVQFVREELVKKYGEEMANRGGLKVFTTIDLSMQQEAQAIAGAQIDNLRKQGASNAALVAMNPRTGEILAMVGSVDYTDPRFGEVNVAVWPRQPGSSIKPVTYATGLQLGLVNPYTRLPDKPVKYPDGMGGYYQPQNYDLRFHGAVTVRSALANSFNIPAVEMLDKVGVPRMLDTAHRMGITTLNDPGRYGLALTLGGGEVRLLDLTSVYATLANYGYHVPATPFLKIVDAKGNVLEELDRGRPSGEQAVDKGVAYQISDILSDNEARTPMFGANSPLRIDGLVAAAKTGTTNDWKDSWTMGYTPALAVGVWVGNNDGRPMAHVAGAIGAAPIWHNFVQKVYGDPKLKALLFKPGEASLPDKFFPPPGMLRAPVCIDSGMAPAQACLNQRFDWFSKYNVPEEPDTWHRWVPVTLHNGGASVAGPGVPSDDIIERIFIFPPPELQGLIGGGPPLSTTVGITATGQAAPLPTPLKAEPPSIATLATPAGDSAAPRQRPPGLSQPDGLPPIPGLQLAIFSPSRGQAVSGQVPVTGQAVAADFARFRLEYGPGDGASSVASIAESTQPVPAGTLGVWNTDGLPAGPYTLWLTLETRGGDQVRTATEVRVGGGLPSVAVSSPSDGSTVYTGEAIDIEASPDGAGAPLAGVELYVDGKRIASLTAPPWTARWAVITGTHELRAMVYTVPGDRAVSAPVLVAAYGPRPTPTPTLAPIFWISNLTLYKEVKPGVNQVWVDVAPNSTVRHVDVYVDGYPAGYATGPGFRSDPAWTATPTASPTAPPTPTLDPAIAATATAAMATAQAEETRAAAPRATREARVIATAAAKAAVAAATAAARDATATALAATEAATTSPTPAPPTDTPLPPPTPTFVRYGPVGNPMLGDFVARCIFTPGRHRITAIGYDQDNHEVGRDETWVIVR